MRNWNFASKVLERDDQLLPDYLWGIETSKVGFSLVNQLASRLPMRNWNPAPGDRGGLFRGLPDYLWGIETSKVGFSLVNQLDRFQTTYEELKRDMSLSFLAMFCFQTTYEELKLFNNKNNYVFWYGFQTTYEELKLDEAPATGETTGRFQTTYEELKLQRFISLSWNMSASRLPMRNWNRSRPREDPRGRCFQTTYEELKHPMRLVENHEVELASRLPMRNWNSLAAVITSIKTMASRLPMRNWNRDNKR
mgnify:CR=1 FL=1